MAKGLLKKLALGTAIAGSALFGAKDVNAAPVNWSSYSDIVPTTVPLGFDNPAQGESIPSTVYNSSSSVSAPNNFSAIYFIDLAGSSFAVGGFDVRGGVVTKGSFNNIGKWIGLSPEDTANSAVGSNPQNQFGGYWEVFYDSKMANGSAGSDGILGTFETDAYGNFQYFSNRNEQLSSTKYNISNFSAYNPSSSGTFDFSTSVPEPTVLTYLALGGAITMALRRRRDESGKKKCLA